MTPFSKHISFEQLTELAEKRLNEVDRRDAELHLSSCSECNNTLGELQRVFSLMASDSTESAPRDVLFRAISLFGSRPEKSSLAKRILAVLTFDSLSEAPAFGLRSGNTDQRQLIYSAEDNDIDLHISTQDNKWIIAGQVLGNDCNNGEVVVEGDGVKESSRLNDSCEFSLPAVPPGEYRLRLRLSDIEVEVPRLALHK